MDPIAAAELTLLTIGPEYNLWMLPWYMLMHTVVSMKIGEDAEEQPHQPREVSRHSQGLVERITGNARVYLTPQRSRRGEKG